MTDRERAVLGLMGLARKGGNAAVGRDPVRDAVRRGRARLIVVAADAGDAINREVQRIGEGAQIPILTIGTRDLLGRALGRAEVSVTAFTDAGLAEAAMAEADDQLFARRKV